MQYDKQRDVLRLLFLAFTGKGDSFCALQLSDCVEVLAEAQAGRAFLVGCRERGWVVNLVDNRWLPTGALFRAHFTLWTQVCPWLRPAMVRLAKVLAVQPGGCRHDMDALADDANVSNEERAAVWSTLLECVPPLSAYHSWSLGDWLPGKRMGEIALNETMLDDGRIMSAVDMFSSLWEPHPMTMPLRVTAT